MYSDRPNGLVIVALLCCFAVSTLVDWERLYMPDNHRWKEWNAALSSCRGVCARYVLFIVYFPVFVSLYLSTSWWIKLIIVIKLAQSQVPDILWHSGSDPETLRWIGLEAKQRPPGSLAPVAGLLTCIIAILISVTFRPSWTRTLTDVVIATPVRTCVGRPPLRQLSASSAGLWQLQLHHGRRPGCELLIIIVVRRLLSNYSTQRIVIVVVDVLFHDDSLRGSGSLRYAHSYDGCSVFDCA